jgi:hypothetical protein
MSSTHAALETDVAEMIDHHRYVFERTQQIGILQQVFAIDVQPRVPAELANARHRAPDLGRALLHRKKADKIETRAAHTGRM